MGSLNGDVMVMRNGRSTSQVSIYNYPEHLNPFYEDDQHKRLRFWKISKKDNEGRRNSFSIGNLKDMWAFKSFRMKKKSSTLGINKTSESPPTLRRDYALENGWNTFDHRLRGSTTSSINGDNFQRNATYRSSLQTLPSTNDRIGLNRNDGYRSTIQVPRSNPRYQPQQKQQTMGVSQNRRSSQSSMVSTNPFESDDDDEDINTSSGLRSVNGGSTTTLTSRTYRKKRRAPAPPTAVHGLTNGASPPTIRIESSQDNTQNELRIEEDIDIANLTAEIESFVKTKDNDEVEETTPKNTPQTPTKITADEIATTTPTKESTKKVENIEIKIQEKAAKPKTPPAPKDTNQTKTSIVVSEVSTKETNKTPAKTNGQVTTEIVTITTTTRETTTKNDVTKPEEKHNNVAQITEEIVTKTEENKQINKSNGAIPKKSNNTVTIEEKQQSPIGTNIVEDLCIKEKNTEELPQKPVPLKRQTKPETEVGQVECIHVHVESPRATPRKDHSTGVSSFKTNETIETNNETITTKTPFVLTSPPTRRRKSQQAESEPVTRETVKIIGTTERTNELNIKEERINVKPEISVKPTLSPKPILKEPNGKVHGFAEIHKPARKFITHQNGHVPRASRDESVSPPTVPLEKPNVEEKKIINSEPVQSSNSTSMVEKQEVQKAPEVKTENTLKIVETTTTNTISNGTATQAEETGETKKVNVVKSETTVTTSSVSNEENHNGLLKRDEEFELLYRPKPANQMEWRRSTLAPLETNIPPEKRKSVKDIIESINRSQRLLNAAANKDFTALQNPTNTSSTTGSITVTTVKTSDIHNDNNLNENLKVLDERQKEIQRLVEEMSPTTSNASTTEEAARAANSSSPTPSNYNNECNEAQKLDNNEIFQKCKVKKEVYDYRESSPISSNLDWNPVPKPKRTKPGNE